MEEKIMRVAVTGAARGIGAATARLLMQRGWRVACLDRDLDAARQIAGDHPAIAVDVAEEESVIGAFAKVREALGGLDALATCAGIFETTPFFETTAKTFRRVHDVNVIGTFLSLREAVGMMQPGARICTVASVAGLRGGGLSGTISYASSKGAILALTKNAARMLGPRGIAVNTIAPGVIDTPFVAGALAEPGTRQRLEGLTSFNRLGTAEEIAEAIAWLLSPAASYVPGATRVADGGMVRFGAGRRVPASAGTRRVVRPFGRLFRRPAPGSKNRPPSGAPPAVPRSRLRGPVRRPGSRSRAARQSGPR
ncbi:MAG: SDR family oxidoreductase [Dongiales bacterium]